MSIFKKVVAGLSATTIALSVVSPVSTVSANNSEVEAANKLATNGIIKNQDNAAAYNLDKEITRREFIKVVANLGGLTVTDTCEGKFEDLSSTDWGCKYAEAALKAGYISANAKYNPDMNVSKWEAMKMILKAKGLNKSEGFESFEAAYVDAAVKAGYVESFTDYNTSAKRGWLFVAGAASIEDKDTTPELCEILGTCKDKEPTVKPTEPTTPTKPTTPSVSSEDELQVALNPKNPDNGSRIPRATPRVEFMVFDVTAGSEDVELKTVKFEAAGFGASANIDDVVVYNTKGEKITRQRSVNSDDEAELDFKNEFTVKAGTTETLTVTAQVNNGSNGDVYALNMTELKASSTVEGATIKGSQLEAVTINNQGVMVIKADIASKDVTIGEKSKLGGFKLKNDNDKEDISIKTIRFKQVGTIDEDNVSDLELLADGKVVVSDMSFNKEYVTANFGEGYVLSKDKSSYVTFELKGTIIGDPTKTVGFQIEESDDIFAVGVKNGYNTPVKDTSNTAFAGSFAMNDADFLKVEGANVNVTFTRSEKDEVSADTDDFEFGTLKFESFSGNYNLKKMTATVTYTATTGNVTSDDLLENVKLGNISVDNETSSVSGSNSTETVKYEFEDIFLKKGEAKEFVVTADIKKGAANIKYQIDLTFRDNEFELEDEDNDETYTEQGQISDIFSNYSGLDSRSVEVKDANLEITRDSISNEDVVLGDSTILVFKGDIEAGSAEDVKLNSLTFTNDISGKVDDIDKIIAKAFLKIGSETIESTDINATQIKFTGLSKVIKAGSSNKADFELSVKFKKADDSAITKGSKDKVSFKISATEAEGVDTGNDVAGGNFKVPTTASNTVTLATRGSIKVKVDTEEDDSNVVLVDEERFALAGTNNVVLAKVELDSDKEDIKVKDLTFVDTSSTNGDGTKLEDSFTNVRLVKSDLSTLIANANTSVEDGSGSAGAKRDWKVRFEDISNFEVDTEGKTVVYVVADVKAIDEGETGGNAVSGTVAKLEYSAAEYEGVNSVDTLESSDISEGNKIANNVTVVASDVASVEVNERSPVFTGTSSTVAEIVFTPKTSSNVDASDDKITSNVKKVTLSGVNVSGVSDGIQNFTFTLRDKSKTSNKVSVTPSANATTVEFDATNTDLEIDGTTTLEILVDIANGKRDNNADNASVKFDLDRATIEILDGTDTNANGTTTVSEGTTLKPVYSKNSSVTVQ